MSKKTDQLLEILLAAQSENDQNYIDSDNISQIAQRLELAETQVVDTASFYKDISFKPRGLHIIRLCKSPCCWLQGGREIAEILEEELGIQMGETTADGKFSFEYCGCIGACDQSPAIMIDERIIGNLTPENVKELLHRYREAET